MRYQIDDVLTNVVFPGVSDIHIKPGHPPMVRLNGELVDTDKYPPFAAEDTQALAYQLFRGTRRKSSRPVSRSTPRTRSRASRASGSTSSASAATRRSCCASSRCGSRPSRSCACRRSCARSPRSSAAWCWSPASPARGKSTTLACMINYINSRCSRPHPHHRGPDRVPLHRQPRLDQPARDRLRHAELRRRAARRRCARTRTSSWSARCATSRRSTIAIKAAEMGHLVFSTLHTTDCAEDDRPHPRRLPGAPAAAGRGYQLATSLKAVISMRLLPKADGKGRVLAMEIMIADLDHRGLHRGRQEDRRHQGHHRGRQDPVRHADLRPAPHRAVQGGRHHARDRGPGRRRARPTSSAPCSSSSASGTPRTGSTGESEEMDVNRLIAAILQKNPGRLRPALQGRAAADGAGLAASSRRPTYPKLQPPHSVAMAKAVLNEKQFGEFEKGKASTPRTTSRACRASGSTSSTSAARLKLVHAGHPGEHPQVRGAEPAPRCSKKIVDGGARPGAGDRGRPAAASRPRWRR